jgi:hypothetical protein
VWYVAGKVLLLAGARVLQAEAAVDDAHIRLPCPSGEFFATD